MAEGTGHDVSKASHALVEATSTARVEAIDWMRGLVMVLMALDHVRYFFTNVPFPPEHMPSTWPALFATRWVTHFCAPAFFLLAGSSAWLSGRRKSQQELSRHLVRRGLLLVALELTVIGFSWVFTPGYSFGGVIWSLGWSMVALSIFSRIPPGWLAALSLGVIFGHDLLNPVDPSTLGPFENLWRVLHVPGKMHVFGFDYFILYVLVPWSAVMALGYAMGPIWTMDPVRRRRLLAILGSLATLLFVILRLTNSYGNPAGKFGGRLPFEVHDTIGMTIVSLLNVSKYPGSLQYMLMTLGPILAALAALDWWFADRAAGELSGIVITFGRAPMFYYISHLYWIHSLALVVATVAGQPSAWLGWGADPSISSPPGYGYGLATVYAIWAITLVVLYFPTRHFAKLKRTRRNPWMSYL